MNVNELIQKLSEESSAGRGSYEVQVLDEEANTFNIMDVECDDEDVVFIKVEFLDEAS